MKGKKASLRIHSLIRHSCGFEANIYTFWVVGIKPSQILSCQTCWTNKKIDLKNWQLRSWRKIWDAKYWKEIKSQSHQSGQVQHSSHKTSWKRDLEGRVVGMEYYSLLENATDTISQNGREFYCKEIYTYKYCSET